MRRGIIIEGPNGAGKSVLSTQLSTLYNIPVHHAGPNDKTLWSTLCSCFRQVRCLRKGHILDRCTPTSKVVYNKGMKKYVYILMRILYNLFYSKHIVIYCNAYATGHVKPYYTKEHCEYVLKFKDEIHQMYDMYYTNIRHIEYNWKTNNLVLLMEKIDGSL